ncbi:MAG: protein-disulfide reductase DsbD [Burkholderiaceae bacterium]|nr:protein-disulfide reductase DsbD [Burkholderiaceae bacterium]
MLAYCFSAIGICFFSQFSVAQTFLAPEQAFYIDANVSNKNIVNVNFKIASGYYLYQERFEFSIENSPISITNIGYPPAKVKYDPTFEKDMGLYFKQVKITVILSDWTEQTNGSAFILKVVSQGCAEQGICYPPVTSAIQIEPISDLSGYRVISITANLDDDISPRSPTLQINNTKDASTSPNATNSNLVDGETNKSSFSSLVNSADDSNFTQALNSGSFWGNIALFFVLGLLLSLTPCVLPMIPILSMLIVGQGNQVSRTRGFGLAASYVAGMSLIYTALGVFAGLSGASLALWLQTPWVLSLFAALLVLMGLAMFDIVRFEMPQSIQTKLTHQASSLRGGKAAIAFVMGALSALILGPCVAAPLAGALLYISQTRDVWLGGGALFAMAWGMGIPLLLLGASAGTFLPKAGAWMEDVKKFFGVLLLATAWWMLSPVISSQVNLMGWAFLAIFSGFLLGTFNQRDLNRSVLFDAVKKTIGFVLMLLAIFWLVGAMTGARSLLDPLSEIALKNGKSNSANSQSNTLSNYSSVKPAFQMIDSVEALQVALSTSTKPVMLDFYADWCVSCKEMEAFTFTDSNVINRMQQFLLLKADVTKNTPQHRELLKKFNLFGPPGILFFEPGGREIKNIRVVGFQSAEKFTPALDRVLGMNKKP